MNKKDVIKKIDEAQSKLNAIDEYNEYTEKLRRRIQGVHEKLDNRCRKRLGFKVDYRASWNVGEFESGEKLSPDNLIIEIEKWQKILGSMVWAEANEDE